MGRSKPKKVKTTERKVSRELREALAINADNQVAIQKEVDRAQASLGNLQNRFIAEARAALCLMTVAMKPDEEMIDYDPKKGIVTCQKKGKRKLVPG